ncbi:hypothetical protein [Cytobacillus purgationiresistens]|uniref:Ca2+/Na+ antiporter n=1 Tax=Cytobacillus purgationiresistens TaxID=863449 RepID=A0ABU0ABC2_9BACI|nr:hypothetical protein [Cytobacillus purgationiresistens]MDQ0268320.1 Ca2+/Na+ antiporter [Cytobacillus purgationiresistens]
MIESAIFPYLLLTGIILILIECINAFSLQQNKGFIAESLISTGFVFVIAIAQFVFGLSEAMDVTAVNTIYIFIFILIVYIIYRIFIYGRVYTVHRTTRSDLVNHIKRELNTFDIPYIEEESMYNKKHTFNLLEDHTKLIISWNRTEKSQHTYTLIFKKWWKIHRYHEMKENLREIYIRERQDLIFKKELVWYVIEILFLIFTLFFVNHLLK